MGEPILTGEIKRAVSVELEQFRNSVNYRLEKTEEEQKENFRKIQHIERLFRECVCSKCEKRLICSEKPGG